CYQVHPDRSCLLTRQQQMQPGDGTHVITEYYDIMTQHPSDAARQLAVQRSQRNIHRLHEYRQRTGPVQCDLMPVVGSIAKFDNLGKAVAVQILQQSIGQSSIQFDDRSISQLQDGEIGYDAPVLRDQNESVNRVTGIKASLALLVPSLVGDEIVQENQ